MSVARTKSQTPGIFSFGKSGTSPCSSYEETIETSADFTTFAGTEGRASSAWPTEKSSGPSFARTTRGHIAWRENWSAHRTRNLWWISGKRTMASVRFGPARGVDSFWANLDDRAPDLPAEMGEFFSRFRRFAFEDLRLGARKTYEVEANWKILGEYYSDCQDWSVCERTQKGTHSRAWKGGRFSAQESQVHDFEKYVSKRMKEPLDPKDRHRPCRSPRRRGRGPRAA